MYAEAGARIKYFVTDQVWFSVMIFASISVAAGSVGLGTYGTRLPDSVQPVLDVIDAIVLSFFTVEAALKIWAEGRNWQQYFQEPWNVFDFSVRPVCCLNPPPSNTHTNALAQIVIASFLPIPSEYQSLVRLIRLLRVLKIVRALSGLRVLVVSLFKSLQSLAYIAGLLLLVIYIYGVLGFSMFHLNVRRRIR
jgi:voltage-gated sodium channel